MKKTVFKATSLVICIALIVTSLCIAPIFSAADDKLFISVASDLHYEEISETLPLNMPDNELFFHAEGSGVLYDETEPIIRDFLESSYSAGADCIIIPGDLTRNGSVEQHTDIATLLGDFESRTGLQVYVVPGNHDLYRSTPEQFRQIYAAFGYDEANVIDSTTSSYTVDLPGGYRLIGINSCHSEDDGDAFNENLYLWVEQQAAAAKADGKKPIGMMHHPLLQHIPLHSLILKDFIVTDWEKAANRLADCGIEYFFTGHEHGNDIASFVSKAGNPLYDVLTASLTAYPMSYRFVTFDNSGVKFENQYIDSIDFDSLTDGYTEAQLALMRQDYREYSYGYFKASIEKKIANTVSPEKLKRVLGAESGVLADAVDLLLPLVTDALAMPLYETPGQESIQSLAAKCGVTLPESDYKNLYDLAASLVALHYCGDEDRPMSSCPEGELFIKGLNTGLKSILAGAGDETVTALVNSVAGKLGLGGVEKIKLSNWAYALAKGNDNSYEIASAVLKPLLDSFLVDTAPADRDVTLPAYGTAPEGTNAFADFFAKLISFIKYLLSVITAVVKSAF